MDRLSAYAKWLIENEDKKGTPDFETVANAYRSLRGVPDSLAQAQKAYDEAHKPVEYKPEPKPEKQSVFRQVADVPIGIARGAAQGIRMIADAFGPDNVVSQAYRGMEDYLGELYSAQAKNDQKKIAQIMKDAEDKGIGDQLVAAVKAFATAPVDMLSQALGTAAPIVVGGLAGSVARLGAAGVGAVQTGLGAAMGAGTVKGTIYEAVKSALTESGEDPRVAEQKAREAQSYTGENWGQVLAGTVLGGVAGRIGVEDLLLKRFTQKAAQEGAAAAATPGVLRRAVTAGGTEAVPEMAQAGQEQLAENIALQRQGFDVPTMRGVAGQAALEGLAGFGLGAGLGAMPSQVPSLPFGEKIKDETTRQFAEQEKALSELQKKLEEGTITEDEYKEQAKEIAKNKKQQTKLKLEDLDPTKVEELRTELTAYTDEPDKIKEKNSRKYLINSLKRLGVTGSQLQAFERIKSRQDLLNAVTKFVTPKEEQGEQLDQLDQSAGGEGAGVSGEPGAGTTAAGTTAPSGVGVGGAPDASQQAGVGAKPPDTTLTTPPTTPPATPPVTPPATPPTTPPVTPTATPPTTPPTDFKPAPIRLEGVTYPPKIEAAISFLEEFNKGFSKTKDINKAAKALDLDVENKADPAETLQRIRNVVSAYNNSKTTQKQEDIDEDDDFFIKFDPSTYYGITYEEAEKFRKASRLIQSGRIYDRSEDQQQKIRQHIRDIQNKLRSAQEKVSGPARLEADIQLYDAAREEINAELKGKIEEDIASAKVDIAELKQDLVNPNLSEEEKQRTQEGIDEARSNIVKLENRLDKARAFGSEFDKLPEDQKQFFLNVLSNDPTIENAIEALKLLQDYKATRREELESRGLVDEKGRPREGLQLDTIVAYEANRRAESKGRGIVFPSWNQLTQEEKTAFSEKVPRITKGQQGPTGETIASGFDAIEQGIAEKQADIIRKQRETEAASREKARQKVEEEADLAGLKTPLPQEVVDDVKSGKSEKLLKHLSENAKGPKNAGPFRAVISRMLASVLQPLVRDTKIKYIPRDELAANNRPESFIASYSAKTDTVYVTDRGLSETALLHEFVHAATIKTIFKYLNGRRNELTAPQRQGVAAIIKMYNYLKYKTTLGTKYPTAFSNVYEFVSYGLTDPRLEKDLIQMKSGSLALYTDFLEDQEPSKVPVSPDTKTPTKTNVLFGGQDLLAHIRNERKLGKEQIEVNYWQRFAKAVADALGLTYRYSRLFLHKLSNLDSKEFKKAFEEGKQSNLIKVLEEGISSEAKTIGEALSEESEDAEQVKATEKEYKRLTKKIDESLNKLRASLSQGLEKGQTATYERLSNEEAQKKLDQINKSVVTTDPAEKAKFIAAYKADIKNKNRPPEAAENAFYKSGKITRRPFTKEEANEIKRLETLIQINNLEADKERIAGDLGFVGPRASLLTEADFSKVTTIEPGYLGNLFVELMAAFEAIASPPEAMPEFRIQNISKTRGEVKKAPGRDVVSGELLITDAEADKVIDEVGSRFVNKMEQQNPTLATKTKSVASMFNKDGRTRIVELMQNYRYRLDRLQDVLRRAKKLISFGDKQNNIGTATSAAAGRAETIYQKNFFVDIGKANELLADLAKSMNTNVQDVLARLHMYAIHLHDSERREIKYLREVPLVDNQAVTDREEILNKVIKIDRKKLGDTAATDEAKKLRKDLEALVNAKKDTSVELSDMNSDAYNTLGPYSLEQIEAFGRAFKGDNKVKADELIKLLQKIENTTIKVNQKSNYFSPPVQNLVDFYGFKHYFPFKGRPDTGPSDYKLDVFGQNVGGDLQDKQEAFDGRITDSDNPILNVLNEASKSAMRLGRHEAGVTLSIKNLIDSKIIAGKKVATITFEQRFDNKLNQELKRGVRNIFHYLPDGKIEIYEIKDDNMLQAIKRPLRDDNWFIDSVGKATSFFGQMHTRFNPAFAPMDFLRNLFTYAGVLGAETSGKRGAQVLSEMSKIVAKNGFGKTAKFSLAFSRGNEAEMNRLAKADPFYADLKDFYDMGGRVAYLQGISISDNLSDAVNAAQQNGMIKSLSGANKFFDAWLDMFEMSTRVAAYRTIRDQFVADGMPLEQAKIEAVAYAKNLANFEKTGLKGKELGAFFMFFRPAATGAVRSYQALSPALDYFKSDEELKKIVTKEAEDVKGLKAEDINRLVADYRKRAQSAAIVSGALFAIGMASFGMAAVMAGDDDRGRNKTLSDDTARWVRNARFNTGIQSGGKDLVIQIPWGFGPGAFAAVGAQIAAFGSGASSFGQFINNVLDAGAESFMPIPISKINKLEHPVEAALDSVLPSALKPLFEWAMNMDGLGREIYNNRQSRNNDAYTGGDNIPEIFKDAARLVYNMSDGKVDVSPNTLYFFLNNYLDGMSRLGAWSYNMAHTVAGNRDFDFKTDTLLLDAYLKAPSNYDARQFSEVEKEIKDMERRYRAFTSSGDSERMSQYFQDYPYDKAVVDYYNKFNGQLNKLREMANKTRQNTTLTIKERQDQVRLIIDQQNRLKSGFVQSVAAYGIEP